MNGSELPGSLRVKPSEESRALIWSYIEQEGGIRDFCSSRNISESKVYNWKNKDSYLPIRFIRELELDEIEISGIKGRGRSKAIKNPEFPLEENNELLTRVEASVSVNKNGTPIYQTDDRGNAERFVNLLNNCLGDVPTKVYSRDRFYQVTYPSFLQRVFREMDYEKSLTALIDEKGGITQEGIIVGDEVISFGEVDEELHHRTKKLELALAREDKESIEKILGQESDRIRSLIS